MVGLKQKLDRRLMDELLDEVIEAETRDERMNKATDYKKPEYLDPVQWRVEKAIIKDFYGRGSFLTYGVIIDVVNYISEGMKLRENEHVNFAWKKYVSKGQVEGIAGRLVDVVLKAIKECGIPQERVNKEVLEALKGIIVRYRNYCEYGDRGRYGERGKKIWLKERVPYEVGWSPWFKGLNERFMEDVWGRLTTF